MSATASQLRLSGNAYVPVRLREESEARPTPLRIVAPRNCDHTSTVCATRECVVSWQIDWVLYFDRTGGGRELSKAVAQS